MQVLLTVARYVLVGQRHLPDCTVKDDVQAVHAVALVHAVQFVGQFVQTPDSLYWVARHAHKPLTMLYEG